MSDPHTVPTLDGKVAVITGSTRGLGLATAAAMLDAGARVIVSSRGSQAVGKAITGLAEGGRPVDGSACDVGDLSQVEALLSFAVQRFGRVDVWINNAGLSALTAQLPTSQRSPSSRWCARTSWEPTTAQLWHCGTCSRFTSPALVAVFLRRSRPQPAH